MKNKPRGSQAGLKKNRSDTKKKNTDAMWVVVNRLRKEKPSEIWSYKEVWSGAGLKSHVPLASPWNASIRGAINSHNLEVKQSIELGKSAQTQRKNLRETVRELHRQLQLLRSERDIALSKIATYEADADYYKVECQSLALINARLRKLSLK